MRLIIERNGRVIREVKVKSYHEAAAEFINTLNEMIGDRSKLIPP